MTYYTYENLTNYILYRCIDAPTKSNTRKSHRYNKQGAVWQV